MNDSAFFSELPAAALHGALFTGIAFVAWLCFRRQSAARHSVCGRLIIAASLAVTAAEIFTAWHRHQVPVEVSPQLSPSLTEAPLPTASPTGEEPGLPILAAGDGSVTAPATQLPVTATGSPPRWSVRPQTAAVLSLIWAAGAAIILLRWMLALILRHRMTRGAADVSNDSWSDLLPASSSAPRRVRLLRSPSNAVPCAWGVFRPVILLPRDAVAWPESQRRMVLAHECAHLRRRDPLWQVAGQILLALQWFNPAAWLLIRRCRMADERAADDAVLQIAGDAPAYAEILVYCARQWFQHPGIAAVTSGMASPSSVCRRVECVLDAAVDRRPAGVFWPTVWSLLCATLAAAVVLLTPRMSVALEPIEQPAVAPWPADREPQTLEELHAALDTVMLPEVNHDAVLLSDVIHSLYERTKVNFIVRADGDKRLTLNLRDSTLRGAVESLCKATGLDYEIQQQPVIIVRAAGDGGRMITRTYRIPDSFPGVLPKESRSGTAMLREAGIETAEGSLASFDFPTRRLVAKNTPEQHRRLYVFSSTGKADGPFPWHPVKIGEANYLSAGEIQIYYGCTQFPDGGPTIQADGALTIGNRRFAMTLRRNETSFSVNNHQVSLTHPVIEHEKMLWIAKDDFTSIIEPKLRPVIAQAPPATPPAPPAPPAAPVNPGGEPPPNQPPPAIDPAPANPDSAAPPSSEPPADSASEPAPDSPPEKNSRSSFEWKPVKIGEREYVSAEAVARFYGFPKVEKNDDGTLSLGSIQLLVRWRKDSTEMLINKVRFHLKHPVIEHEGGLWLSRYDLAWHFHPVVKPSHIGKLPPVSTVIIDAGHGGEDNGAIGKHGKESDLTLDTAQRLQTKLEAAGFKVVMTRSDDRFISQPDRIAIANAEENAILISLHFNSHTQDKEGIETYFPEALEGEDSAPETAARISAGVALAVAVHAHTLYKLRSIDGGVRSKELDLLIKTRHPAILIEGGYLSNDVEGARIATVAYREQFAGAVAGGVGKFRKALLTGSRNLSGRVPQR